MTLGQNRLWLLLLLSATLVACDSLGFYSQAATGQLSLLWQRQPIERVLAGEGLSDFERQQLEGVLAARVFAAEELALDVGGSYRAYVELDREHVLWNVFAAPEFSTVPLSWCFPIAGCVSYRGYFARHRAERFARRLAADGHDVYVAGVDAYSTLGWFDDPVYSTLISRPPHRLVALLFHELAHQTVYLPGDTTFNESYASYVEQEGLRRWLQQQGDEALYQQFLLEGERHQQFVDLVIDYRDRLSVLYASAADEDSMRLSKDALQQALRDAHQVLVGEWGVPAYQGWFDGPLNNAQLATVASYHDWVPAFAGLMGCVEGNWSRFHRAVASVAAADTEQREWRLRALISADADACLDLPD